MMVGQTGSNVRSTSVSKAGESGQALIESAIVIPLMTFLILGVIQLSMVQHARIMTEYAAFSAARAGVVWNADRFIMENAAISALMPTNESLRSQSDLANPWQMIRRVLQRALIYQVNRRLSQAVELIKKGTEKITKKLPNIGLSSSVVALAPSTGLTTDQVTGAARVLGARKSIESGVDSVINGARAFAEDALAGGIAAVLGARDDRLVRVDIVSPNLGFLWEGWQSFVKGSSWGAETVEDLAMGRLAQVVGQAFSGQFGGQGEIPFDVAGNTEASRLVIRVRYMYMMRVPFANWIIHNAWLGSQAAKKLYGALWNPQEKKGGRIFAQGEPWHRPHEFEVSQGSPLRQEDLEVVAELADEGVYMLPLTASYSMQMQSDVYRRSVLEK